MSRISTARRKAQQELRPTAGIVVWFSLITTAVPCRLHRYQVETQKGNPRHPRPIPRLSWPAAFVALGMLAAGVTAFGLHTCRRTVTAPVDSLEATARAVIGTFRDIAKVEPRITIRERVFAEQSAELLELALVNRKTTVEREMTHTLMGSTKKIRIRGFFDVKAGFDLTKPFTVDIDDDRVTVSVPPAEILSVEQTGVDVEEMTNGFWNKITPGEVESQIAALAPLARAKAETIGLGDEAEAILLKQLTERLGLNARIEVRRPVVRD